MLAFHRPTEARDARRAVAAIVKNNPQQEVTLPLPLSPPPTSSSSPPSCTKKHPIMTYASRGRSLVETILAVVFGGFLTGFILVLCVGNYYRAKRAMERQRQRRLARLSNGGGNGVVDDSPNSIATSGGSTKSGGGEEQTYLLGNTTTSTTQNEAARRRNNAMMPLVQEDLLLQENPPSKSANVMSV